LANAQQKAEFHKNGKRWQTGLPAAETLVDKHVASASHAAAVG
jgi:hypothetical protein